MSDVQLGRLAPKGVDRDATHVAVVPMVAATEMEPGTHCGLVGDGQAGLTDPDKYVGIVDPFLPHNVRKGERFYLCLYPRTVTGLRHHYLHPALDGDSMVTSRDWIEKWAASNNIAYDELIYHAGEWVKFEAYWCEGGRFEGQQLPDEFWEHYDRVTETQTPEERRERFFTCSC